MLSLSTAAPFCRKKNSSAMTNTPPKKFIFTEIRPKGPSVNQHHSERNSRESLPTFHLFELREDGPNEVAGLSL